MNYFDKQDIARDVANRMSHDMYIRDLQSGLVKPVFTNNDHYSFIRFIIHAVFAVCIGGFVATVISNSIFLGIIAGIVSYIVFVIIHSIRAYSSIGTILKITLKYLAVIGISIGVNAIINAFCGSTVVAITAIITLIVDIIIIKIIGNAICD